MRKPLFSRLLSAALTAVFLLSLLPGLAPAAGAAEDDAVTGSISATLRLDYDQSLETLEDRQVQAELLQGEYSLGFVALTQAGTQSLLGGYEAQVSLRDGDGGPLYGNWPGFLDFSVDGLPRGTYTLRFTGEGFVDYEETVVMEEYAHHIILGTGDATFSLGDVNGDGRVDDRDRAHVAEALGSGERRELAACDLNGDGMIDIIDLAYINRMIRAAGEAQLLETRLLLPPVDTAAMEAGLEELGVSVASGNLEDLFRENGKTVTFQENEAGEIVLPLEMRRTVELEQLKIVSPEYAAPLAGTVEVEDETGEVYRFAFDNTLPEGIRALSIQEGSKVITIDLGKRVAVKKVTITVTRTENGFAAVESIQFLKEMIPADPSAAESQVTGLAAVEGSEQVSLRWNALPNISGYRVDWWPVSDPSKSRTKTVDVNRAEITGLENLVAYAFTVTAVDGSWSGKTSAQVTATPQPAAAPSAPDMVSVSALDGALGVGWKAAKGATWYEVYYTDREDAPLSDYRLFGQQVSATGVTITGLENGTDYYIYIIAGNEIGRSGASRVSTGRPQAVSYVRPAGIPSQGIVDGEDIADIRLAAPSNYSRTEYAAGAPFSPWNMADGDYRTHWTVRDWWSNEHVIVTFREPQDLRAAIWVPRLDGTYASNLRTYSVHVWYENESLSGPGHLVTPGVDNGGTGRDVDTWPNVRGNPAAEKFAVMPFTPQKNVIQISVAAEQRGYTDLSLCELMFLKYDENYRLPEEIGELFADGLHTVLASGVTRERIEALRRRLESDERNYYLELNTLADELTLAQELLERGESSGVILDGIQSRSAARDSARYGQGGSELQPLGVAAAAGTEITVYADGIPEGEKVTVCATQFNAEASAWRSDLGTLVNGRNVLTVPRIGSENTARGGSLYIGYTGSGGEGIRLHVRRGTDIPVLELSRWNSMSAREKSAALSAYLGELDAYLTKNPMGSPQADWRNVTEISTPSVLLSLPAAAVKGALKDADRAAQLERSVLAWEEVMEICRTVQGIGGTLESRQNIRCMQMFSGAFMYAAGSHIGIGYGSCAGMVSGAPVSAGLAGSANRLFGWGIAHEIGHNMDKLGKAEITNNIYSLAVQTWDGGQSLLPSRLEKSGKYAAIFNKTAQSLPGASGDVFVQLGMYWQLHLAYDGGEKPLDFFTRFFAAWKAGTYTAGASSYDEKVALTASGVVGRNLTDFFEHWGMTLSDGVKARLKAAYPAEERAVWYLNDQSRRERLAGTPAAQGTVMASAVKTKDNEVRLSFQAEVTAGKVQGYEIARNGTAIAFTTGTTYTDTIGSGVNRTYDYTVTAYDILGNRIGQPAQAGTVRIAYDLLVDPQTYEISRIGDGTVEITMDRAQAVTGLKLPREGLGSGSFQVTVTDENGQKLVAREGSFAENQSEDPERFITWFQRQGASSGSGQVWTYQAKELEITGIPTDIPLEDVRPVSYMGDDIAFLEGAAVGRMAQTYRYGPGAEDVIPAGTLVVAGTYRGDPVYNTVRIRGEFPMTDMTEEHQDGDPAGGGSVTRYIDGDALLFAGTSEDGLYTNISDGFFLFIPDEQAESLLQGKDTSCGGVSILPARICAELWRTDEPNGKTGTRLTAQTIWISSPGGDELPLVKLEGGGAE